MPVTLDPHMRETIAHEADPFPISYFENELAELPGRQGPLHWHPDFEIARAAAGTLEYQVGRGRIRLEAGDSLFVNGNLLHGVRQIAGGAPDPMPVIVFSGTLIAPETSAIYQNYIVPVADGAVLPYVVFRRGDDRCREVHGLLDEIFTSLKQRPVCYEMTVQRDLNRLFAFLFRHLDALPGSRESRVQLRTQVRVQKMLAYINAHYAEPVTLADIAAAASVSRSEAARCFQEYMGCSPVSALIRCRLQTAHRLLRDGSLTVQAVGLACGFCSTSYFARQFRRLYGYTPGQARNLGK